MSLKEHLSLDVDAARDKTDLASVLQRVIGELTPLTTLERQRLFDTVKTFFGLAAKASIEQSSPDLRTLASSRPTNFRFSDPLEADRSIKDFLLEKSPQTDIERVAALAYFLAKYRGTPHFKTGDITQLNMESAHKPFSNTAFAVENATKAGYLVPSVKGAKQLSAAGEQFIQLLPDREAAKAIINRIKSRRVHPVTRKNTLRGGKDQ